MVLPPLGWWTRKARRIGVAWRAVRRRGGGELARSSLDRLREADGLSHVRALAFQSMFVLLSGFIAPVSWLSSGDRSSSGSSSSSLDSWWDQEG